MQDKKIAMMTWYQYQNYGTVLQASALYKAIKDFGFSPDLINYQNRRISPSLGGSDLIRLGVRKLLRRSGKHYKSEEQERSFNQFLRAHTTQTALCRTYSELAELNSCYDAFICGSDQIWSPLAYDENYFLPFVDEPRKMVAYGPSMGPSTVKEPTLQKHMANHIRRFSHLSVRERKGAELIAKLTQQSAQVVLDPTLLLTPQQWDEIVVNEQEDKKQSTPYMLCYFLGDENKYRRLVKNLSDKLNLPVRLIPVTNNQKQNPWAIPYTVGPAEFVNLVRNANYICTDSFHGMAFAINYNIPFAALRRFSEKDPHNQNCRVENLLQMLDLEDRLWDHRCTGNLQNLCVCDFSKANMLLQQHRQDSMVFLEEALNTAANQKRAAGKQEQIITGRCSGCGACTAVCDKKAVTVELGEEGFYRYRIDQDRCVGCGKCVAVCSMARITAPDIKTAAALYAVQSTSEQVLQRSSSGGVGYEIAKLCQREGRYIFGCVYDPETNTAKHISVRPDDPETLLRLQGSKYIQSQTAEAMQQMLSLADTERLAFFGTPCQVAAADKLLRAKGLRENVVLIDLICHGVPSQFLWGKYLRERCNKNQIGKHPTVLFRDNTAGSHPRRIYVAGEGKHYVQDERKDDFYGFFRCRVCNMKTCYDCPYRERSAADIRLGDYWGSRFNKEKYGVSMVIAVTPVGDGLIQALEQEGICRTEQQELREYWTVQHPYNHTPPVIRETLIMQLRDSQKTLHQLRKKYCRYYDWKEKLSTAGQNIARRLKKD